MAGQRRGIGPKDVAHGSFLWRLHESKNLLDVLGGDAVLARQSAVADHDLLIEDICKWQRAEELREGFINTDVLVLGFYFSFEAVDMVDLLGLVVASRHMQEVLISALPGNQRQHALDRERPSVHEISVEEVLVADCWIAVELEDVVEVVVLSVDVSTDGDLFLVLDGIIHERLVAGEDVLAFLDELESETLVERFLFLEAFHQLNHPK